MSVNNNIIQNNQNKESKFISVIPPDLLLGKTIPKTIMLDQIGKKIPENFIKYSPYQTQLVKAGEININNNQNYNKILKLNEQKSIGKNGICFNDIYTFYNNKNFQEKYLQKNEKIIDNIDMNNETEFSYENKKKVHTFLNNSILKKNKIDTTNDINPLNNFEQNPSPPQLQSKPQISNNILQGQNENSNKEKGIKDNINNTRANNQLNKIMPFSCPIPFPCDRTCQINSPFNSYQNAKPNDNLQPPLIPGNQKIQNENKLANQNIDINKNANNTLDNRNELSNFFNNPTTKSRTIEINGKKNSLNPSELSVLNNPTVKSFYKQV